MNGKIDKDGNLHIERVGVMKLTECVGPSQAWNFDHRSGYWIEETRICGDRCPQFQGPFRRAENRIDICWGKTVFFDHLTDEREKEELDQRQPPPHDHPEIADFLERMIQADTILTELLCEIHDGLKATASGEASYMGQFWLALSFLSLDGTKVSGLCDMVEDLRRWEPGPTSEDREEEKHERNHGPGRV